MNTSLKISTTAVIILAVILVLYLGQFLPEYNEVPEKERLGLAQIQAYKIRELGAKNVIGRIKSSGMNVAVVQMFPDYKGVFWNSDIAPTDSDVLRDMVREGHKQNISVWAWMTTLDIPWIYDEHEDWRVTALTEDGYTSDTGWYERISPCLEGHREYLRELYRELVTSYDIDGVLLQDDLYIGENEDFNPACREQYRKEHGKDISKYFTDRIENLPEKLQFYEWRMKKLFGVVREIRQEIKSVNPDIKLAINIYPDCATEPQHCLIYEGQDINEASKHADYLVFMAYHRLEGKPIEWIEEVARLAVLKVGEEKVVIKVQAHDWDSEEDIPDTEIQRALDLAMGGGAIHTGMFPFL